MRLCAFLQVQSILNVSRFPPPPPPSRFWLASSYKCPRRPAIVPTCIYSHDGRALASYGRFEQTHCSARTF